MLSEIGQWTYGYVAYVDTSRGRSVKDILGMYRDRFIERIGTTIIIISISYDE